MAKTLAELGIDPEISGRIDCEIEQAAGLPNAAYTSEDYARYERDVVLAGTWTCIGVGADVPNPGDVRPVDILGLPLILVRDQKGAVRVFHNVCSHRGMRLVSEPCAVGKALRCPYHAWTYDLEGRLRGTPAVGGPGTKDCPGFDRKLHGLKPVRSAVWFDCVFVNISGDAPDFETHVAPLTERWRDFDQTRIVHGGADSSMSIEVAANWKLAVENFCESYHLPWIHPGLNTYSRLEDHYHIMHDDLFAGQGSRAYRRRLMEGEQPLPSFPGLPDSWNGVAEYIALFPNVMLGIHADHFFAVVLEPVRPDLTIERFEIYYVGEGADGEGFRGARQANAAEWRAVFVEDLFVVEGMQRGRASPAFQGGVFSPVMDNPTHCFHRWSARRLAAPKAA